MTERTQKELAQEIAALEGRDRQGAESLYQMLRGWRQRRLTQPSGYSGEGETAASLFDETESCRIRIFCALARLGIETAALQKIDSAILRKTFLRHQGPGQHRVDLLGAAIEGIERGEDWELRFAVYLNPKTGKEIYYGDCHLVDNVSPETVQEVIAAQRAAKNEILQVEIRVPLTRLFQPLLMAK